MADRSAARNAIAGLGGIAVAAGLLWWCFSRADMDQVWTALAGLTLVGVLPALACEAAVQLSKAFRWTAILRAIGPVKYRNAASAVVIGAAATHLVPLRLDELLRAAVLGRREGIDPGKVLGTVAIDRVIEVFVAGILLGIIALSGELHGWMQEGAQYLWGGFLIGMLLLVTFVRSEERVRERLSASTIPGVAAASGVLGSLAEGLRSLPRGAALIGVIVGSVGEWSATVLFYVWTLHVFGVDAPLSVALLMALGNAVAYSVPNVPGAWGPFEMVQTSILMAAGIAITEEGAMAVALAAHAVLMIPVTVIGAVLGVLEWQRRGPIKLAEASA
ncbi:MAG: flippase-like domain-containing protein [Proteobacteria bacterium]|nr:flippase-like domain-containing protein [Pseudomonadota bacterium]